MTILADVIAFVAVIWFVVYLLRNPAAAQRIAEKEARKRRK